MSVIDVFNGDADGLCALHQLRLSEPASATLVTGVKRDIKLLGRVSASRADQVTVLDVSLDSNRAPLLTMLDAGVQVTYFDHHFSGEIPQHENLVAHIDTAADVCTSLLVDRHMGGRWRNWAIVAAFGDNLREVGLRLAQEAGLSDAQTAAFSRLGECLNYNAYGETVQDLHFDPADLFRQMQPYPDPARFIAESDTFKRLSQGYEEDLACAVALKPHAEAPHATAIVMPDAPWARRVSGVYANQLSQAQPGRAHAILSTNSRGGYTVSVRAPIARASGADDLCRRFPTGGGRKAAAGINDLPRSDLDRFIVEFQRAFMPA
jgi:hypothetical protein